MKRVEKPQIALKIPPFIEFRSDGSIIKFERIMNMNYISGGKMNRRPPRLVYRYVHCENRHPTTPCEKIGTELPYKEEEIQYLIDRDFITLHSLP
jgi:hypothetical protein